MNGSTVVHCYCSIGNSKHQVYFHYGEWSSALDWKSGTMTMTDDDDSVLCFGVSACCCHIRLFALHPTFKLSTFEERSRREQRTIDRRPKTLSILEQRKVRLVCRRWCFVVVNVLEEYHINWSSSIPFIRVAAAHFSGGKLGSGSYPQNGLLLR